MTSHAAATILLGTGLLAAPLAFAQDRGESPPLVIDVVERDGDADHGHRYIIAERYHVAPVWEYRSRDTGNFDKDIWYDREATLYDYEYWGYRYQTRDADATNLLAGGAGPASIAPAPARGRLVVGHDLDRDGRVDVYESVDPGEYDRLAALHAGQRASGLDLRGRVTQIDDVKLVGQRDEHRLIRVETDAGGAFIADLGPDRLLDPVNVEKGDRVALNGRLGSINQQPVLMAHAIDVDGQHYRLSRAGELMRAGDDGKVHVRGEVESVEGIRTTADDDDHMLTRIRTGENESVLADFGPIDLDDVEVDKGDEVRLEGRRGAIDGRTVLLVDRVEVDGESHTIAWTAPAGYADVYASPRERVIVIERPDDDAPREVTLVGPIASYQRTALAGSDRPSHVVMMSSPDGTLHMIDLGPDAPVSKLGLLDLDADDRITVLGTETPVGDTHVIRARSITVDGVRTTLRASP